jgi:hypothetical protein
VHFDNITTKLNKLSYKLNYNHYDLMFVAQKGCTRIYKRVTIHKFDELATKIVVVMTANHKDYVLVSQRIIVYIF